MSPNASFLCPLFKTQMLTEKWLFLEISLYYRTFAMLILWTTYPLWEFIWLRDIPNVLAFELETALTGCDANILVFIPAYLWTWQIHLDNEHAIKSEQNSIWTNNNRVWFDFLRHGFTRKIYFQKYTFRRLKNINIVIIL